MLGTSNIKSPVVFADPKLATGSVNTLQDQPARNVVLGDRVRVSSRILALAGVNYAGLKQEGWGTALTTTHFSQHAFTPSVGVVFKPTDLVSTYFSYMQGLAAGGSAPSTAANAYQYLGPSINEQYEIGAKSELSRAKMSAALFRINAVNEYTDPRDNVYKKDGVEVHRGVELSGAGKITERLTAAGGIMLMRARVDRALNNTSIQGKIPSNVPEQQVRGNFEYRIPHTASLTPTFGVNYSGRRPADATDAHFIQGATVFDAGLHYQPTIYGRRLILNANVSNIGNKAYWTYYGLLLGEPRIVAFSLKGQW
jgi:iron complex outermembrane receptor protein